jgi:hypothetical protein
MRAVEIAVLARAAVPGTAKTRLIPALGADGAAALQSDLTRRALRRAVATGAPVTLWLEGTADEAVRRLAGELGIAVRPQPAGDLGARMLAALRHASGSGRAGIVIGTDCPAQSSADLTAAGAGLADHDVVLQPACDGGYVLIGMRQPIAEVFDGVPWGTDAVLAATRARIERLGLRCAELPELPDLDRPEDVAHALAQGWIDRGAWA